MRAIYFKMYQEKLLCEQSNIHMFLISKFGQNQHEISLRLL